MHDIAHDVKHNLYFIGTRDTSYVDCLSFLQNLFANAHCDSKSRKFGNAGMIKVYRF